MHPPCPASGQTHYMYIGFSRNFQTTCICGTCRPCLLFVKNAAISDFFLPPPSLALKSSLFPLPHFVVRAALSYSCITKACITKTDTQRSCPDHYPITVSRGSQHLLCSVCVSWASKEIHHASVAPVIGPPQTRSRQVAWLVLPTDTTGRLGRHQLRNSQYLDFLGQEARSGLAVSHLRCLFVGSDPCSTGWRNGGVAGCHMCARRRKGPCD